jgi:hypothetical protein
MNVTHLLTIRATRSNLATKEARSRLGRLDGALLDTGAATTGGRPKVAVRKGRLGRKLPNIGRVCPLEQSRVAQDDGLGLVHASLPGKGASDGHSRHDDGDKEGAEGNKAIHGKVLDGEWTIQIC